MFFRSKEKKEPQDLSEVVKKEKELEKKLETISIRLQKLEKDNQAYLPRIGIIRYNPFSEVGGNQSFSIALVNEEGNGLVVTSLYNRENNRVYAKPLEKGESKYSLSDEEKKAVKQAISKNEQTENRK